MVAALKRRDIDAFFLWEPWLTKAVQLVQGAHVLARSEDDNVFTLTVYNYYSPGLMNDAPRDVAATRALIGTTEYCATNREDAAQLTAKAFHSQYATPHRMPASLVLSHFNLAITAGEFFSLLEPSGCGKTPVLRLLAGFLQPTTGTLTLDGHRALLARGQRVAVMPPLVDAAAPAPLQGFVDDEGEGAPHGDKGPHQLQQQASTQRQRGPARAVEHVMIETEVGRLAQAHLAQGGRHGPSTSS
jgi:hypothetical protein